MYRIDVSNDYCSLDVYSLSFAGFLNSTETKNILSPQGIKPTTAYIMHKCSATEVRQPASKQTLQFCIYTVKGTAMLQSHSQQTNENSLFSNILIIR